MQPTTVITPAQVEEVLLNVSVVRPVHLWGPPGIGKSGLVERFAANLGMPCVTLLGTQLAAEDLIGVPELVHGEDGVTRSRFAPPEMIARTEPYVLFLDELNGSSPDIQKAFYSLILDRRIGSYEMPAGSVIIAAGNRATDQAIVKPMSSALVNRMVHVHVTASATDWLAWAAGAGIHPLVLDFIRERPNALFTEPPKHEAPFSTPRSWHMLSDCLHEWGEDVPEAMLRMLATGLVSTAHADQFCAFVRSRARSVSLSSLLKGEQGWPAAPSERDLLHFLAVSLREQMRKQLPASREVMSANQRQFTARCKKLLTQLADLSLEYAQMVVAPDEDDAPVYPAWFLSEVMRDLPRLAAARV